VARANGKCPRSFVDVARVLGFHARLAPSLTATPHHYHVMNDSRGTRGRPHDQVVVETDQMSPQQNMMQFDVCSLAAFSSLPRQYLITIELYAGGIEMRITSIMLSSPDRVTYPRGYPKLGAC